jgi:hypothetical protein
MEHQAVYISIEYAKLLLGAIAVATATPFRAE